MHPKSLPTTKAVPTKAKTAVRRLAAALALTLGAATLASVNSTPAQAVGWTPNDPALTTAAVPLLDGAQVVVDGAGNATAVWSAGATIATQQVWAATRPVGEAWSAPVQLSATGARNAVPRIAVNAAGQTVVVWARYTLPTQILSSTRVGTGAWSDPVLLSQAGMNASGPDVSIDAAGNRTVVWSQHVGGTAMIMASSGPFGGALGAPATLSAAGFNNFNVRVAGSPNGHLLLTWTRSEGTYSRLQAASKAAGGGWTTPVTLSDPAKEMAYADAAVSNGGIVSVVWNEGTFPAQMVRSRMGNAGSTDYTPIYPMSGVGFPGEPHVAFDPDGTATAVWDFATSTTNEVVQTARVPAGGYWTQVSTLTGAGVTDASNAQIGHDGAGRPVVVWEEFVPDKGRAIQAVVRQASGTWATIGTSTAPTTNLFLDDLTVAPNGDAQVLWREKSSGTYQLRSTVLDATAPVVTGVTAPGAATTGAPVTISAAASDTWSPISATYDFGDGSTATSTGTKTSPGEVTHTYSTAGTYTVTATVKDSVGNIAADHTTTVTVSAPPPATPEGPTPAATVPQTGQPTQPSKLAPEVTSLRLSKKKLKSSGKNKVKATVTTTTAATLTLTFTKTMKKRVKGKVKRVTKRVGAITRTVEAGTAMIIIKPRQPGLRLKPGSYTITAIAAAIPGDPTTGQSAPKYVKLKVVR